MGVGTETLQHFFATETGFSVAAKGQFDSADLIVVDSDLPRILPLGHAEGDRKIAGVDPSGQSKFGAIGERQ